MAKEGSRDWLDQSSLRFTRIHVFRVRHGCYECQILESCCEDMKKAWGDDFVGYGPYDELCSEKQEYLSIYQAAAYGCGNRIYEQMPISHCPFCGSEIILK